MILDAGIIYLSHADQLQKWKHGWHLLALMLKLILFEASHFD